MVVDAASFLAGPGAATVLGDYGATVIKIEPHTGDRYRTLKGSYPIDYNWLLTSRNKKSIALDLKLPEARKILHALAAKADIFLTNFIGDFMKRYELDYETIAKLNEKLIYAHITGYGDKGPDVMKRAFDATAWWASTGLMELVRANDAPPATSAPGMGDHATSMSLFSAICAALYRREKTGKGAYVSTSLLANGVWSNGMALQGILEGFDLGERRRAGAANNPFGRIYTTADGDFVLFSIINAAREWPQLAKAMRHPEWVEEDRFCDLPTIIQNRKELVELIEAAMASMSTPEALERLHTFEITHSHVRPMNMVVDDPQVEQNEVIVPTNDTGDDFQRTIMSPIQIEGESKREPKRAPDVGEHTREILTDYLDMDHAGIDDLIEAGVVATKQQKP